MSHRISVRTDTPFLHLVVAGQNSAAAVRAYLVEAILLCRQRAVQDVLIEEHLAGPSLQPLELFGIVEEVLNILPPLLRRVALVDTNPAHDPALMRFAETIGVNRGINVRAFRATDEAAGWLRQSGTNPAPPSSSQ